VIQPTNATAARRLLLSETAAGAPDGRAEKLQRHRWRCKLVRTTSRLPLPSATRPKPRHCVRGCAQRYPQILWITSRSYLRRLRRSAFRQIDAAPLTSVAR